MSIRTGSERHKSSSMRGENCCTRSGKDSADAEQQLCLANATTYQTECTGIDVRCLCSNSDYVNALSCCLSTDCTEPDQQSRSLRFLSVNGS